MRKLLAITALALLAGITLGEDEKPHTPDYGKDLPRKLFALELDLVDAANQVAILDHHADSERVLARVVRVDGKHRWEVPCHVDKHAARVIGGAPGVAGLESGTYLVTVVAGHYGKAEIEVKLAGKAVLRKLKLPNARRLVCVKFVDENKAAMELAPSAPRFEADVPSLGATKSVLPDPVLRLPPAVKSGGSGGFAYRKARGGGGYPRGLVKTDEGRCWVVAFEGGNGVIRISTGKDLFKEEQVEIKQPFNPQATEVKLTPTQEWHDLLAGEYHVRNENDPGYREASKAAPPAKDPQPRQTVKFELTPTVLAWARYGSLINSDNASAEGKYTPGKISRIEPLGRVNGARLQAREHGADPGYALDPEARARRMRAERQGLPRMTVACYESGACVGLFFRVVGRDGSPVRFAEATVHTLQEDRVAQTLLAIERKLHDAGKRPAPADTLSADAQDDMRSAFTHDDEGFIERALGREVFEALQNKENRLHYGLYGAWYNSHWRLDADEDGFVITQMHQLEKDKTYVLYVWGDSRDDLKPDLRILVRGQGDCTDLGVIRLPERK
ncbi:MAG: hypothetical protein KF696_08330 [Planctomycetes bacterium]|nr:hypothetical protein [Planctomycetota bacterium]MCW8135642.1 hypothetical protein [Planctomycetota bacterium]